MCHLQQLVQSRMAGGKYTSDGFVDVQTEHYV